MINRQALFRLFQARTGKTEYQVKAFPDVKPAWQVALVQEYSIQKLR